MGRIKRRVLGRWTHISNLKKNVAFCSNGKRKIVLDIFRISQLSYFLFSQFSRFSRKNYLILESSVQLHAYWEVGFLEIHTHQKKIRQFWNQLAQRYQMSTEMGLKKNRRTTQCPNVYKWVSPSPLPAPLQVRPGFPTFF